MTSFSILDNIEKNSRKIKVKLCILLKNIMKNRAFAPKGQMIHFP